MKKLLFTLLFVALCLAVPSLTAEAASVEDLSYTVKNGQVTITDCDYYATGDLVIPSLIDGYPVTAIGDDCLP